jgi:hypothetical protein
MTAVNGVAVFRKIAFDTPGKYTLTATDDSSETTTNSLKLRIYRHWPSDDD